MSKKESAKKTIVAGDKPWPNSNVIYMATIFIIVQCHHGIPLRQYPLGYSLSSHANYILTDND